MPVIIVLTGSNNGDYKPIETKPLIVGRDMNCDFQLLDPTVSRRHLQLQLNESDQTCMATNLSSTSGVLVNNDMVTVDIHLRDGDLIQLGDTLLLYAVKEFSDVQSAVNYYRSSSVGQKPTIIPRREPDG
ncbi:MAG: FHA domain-containing protein [Planctomycetes bacterium]|nr:FHA domain-containing protein [Planctomycetota bacterium]